MGETDSLTTILPNGLRAVWRHAPGATEFCGLTVNAGSRDETTPERYGLAHFVEHTIFKGTARRSDSYIINRMEAVGGELNAFTTKEETTVYSAIPAGNHTRACELIAELAAESVFPPRKLDLEREVICDEIDSYLDSPAEAAYDLFDEMAYAGNPLAHNILGTRSSVDGITSETCRDYLAGAFTAENAVYFYCGPESADRVFATAAKAFAKLPAKGTTAPRRRPEIAAAETRTIEGNRHQCHTVMGAPIGGLHDPARHAVALATNILGGPGMNALLNLELRERRGLVYTVEASTSRLTDCGMFTIYFGCDHHDLGRCKRLVTSTLHRFASKPMTERRLNACKRQFMGQLTLSLDNKEQLAINCGRALLHGLDQPSPEATAERIREITPSQLRDAAELLAGAPLLTLTLT